LDDNDENVKKEGRTSFLKKRSKKLFCPEIMVLQTPGGPEQKSFLVTFFQKSNCFLI
jgi:hypothetical protein